MNLLQMIRKSKSRGSLGVKTRRGTRQAKVRRPLFTEALEERTLLSVLDLDSMVVDRIPTVGSSTQYTFSIGGPKTVGVTATTVLDNVGDLGGAHLTLSGPGGVVARADTLSGDVMLTDVALSAAGTYTVEVRAPDGAPTRTGDFRLDLVDRNPDPRPIDYGQAMPASARRTGPPRARGTSGWIWSIATRTRGLLTTVRPCPRRSTCAGGSSSMR